MVSLIEKMDGMTTSWRQADLPPPSPAQRQVGVWITARGRKDQQDRPGCHHRSLDQWAVVLLTSGSGWFDSQPSGRLELIAPCLLWLVPSIAHSYGPSPVWSERWLMMDGSLLAQLQASGAIDPAFPSHHLGADSPCLRAWERCWQALDAGDALAMARSGAAIHELATASHSERLGHTGPTTTADPVVAAAIELVAAPGGEDRAPAAIATVLGIAYSTLRRRFHAATGSSLRDWVIDRRLARAKALLLADQRPIHAIATECGFEDPYYFSRQFAARVGCSPRAFRKQGSL